MKKFLAVICLCLISIFSYSAIYVTGQNSNLHPALWITDNYGTKITTRILDNFYQGKALNIISTNDQVFICGTTQHGSALKPCLWITNFFAVPPQKIILSEDLGTALSMAYYDKQLFIVGSCNNKSTLWIVDLTSLQVGQKTIGSGYVIASLTVANERLFLIGGTDTSIAPPNSSATLWLCDLEGNTISYQYIYNIGTVPSSISHESDSVYILSCNGCSPNVGYYLTKVDLGGNVIDKILFQPLSFDSVTYNISLVDSQSFMLTTKGIYTTPLSQINSTPYTLSLPITSSKWNASKISNNVYIAGTDPFSRASLFIYDLKGSLVKTTILDSSGSLASSLITPLNAQLNQAQLNKSQSFFGIKKGLLR